MRAIPDQFFAALFGVWLGLQTDIWKKSVDKILLLVGGLSVIAILFGTFSITNARKLNKNFRNAVGLMLVAQAPLCDTDMQELKDNANDKSILKLAQEMWRKSYKR